MTDEYKELSNDLAMLSRYAIELKETDIRLYMARLVRKYRDSNRELSIALDDLLRNTPTAKNSILRSAPMGYQMGGEDSVRYAGSALLKGPVPYPYDFKPILATETRDQLERIVSEHAHVDVLQGAGLAPSSSLVFVGMPGVGKTMTAHWLADTLGLPLFSVDLATIVGSYLGQTGNNLKTVLAQAKSTPMVLLLDEIDALAKTRGDDSDVGELKRVVTVLLQEIEEWPSSSILIAATNHPEIVDKALWRRFDHILTFALPTKELVLEAMQAFFSSDWQLFKPYAAVMSLLFEGESYSEIERTILDFRRSCVLGARTADEVIAEVVQKSQGRKERLLIAKALMESTDWSQYKINQLTGVSRDTLRKYRGA